MAYIYSPPSIPANVARKDVNNAFSTSQTVTGTVTATSFESQDGLNVNSGTLNLYADGSIQSGSNIINTPYAQLMASSVSIDWAGRTLHDGVGVWSADWYNRRLYDSTGSSTSVDWGSRVLYSSAGTVALDWSSDGFVSSAGTIQAAQIQGAGATFGANGVTVEDSGTLTALAAVIFTGLPTSDPVVAGALWQSGTNIFISTGP